MNRFERFLGLRGLAKVRYLDGEYQVLLPGDHVQCSVTGQKIPLEDLRYWNAEFQEPYVSADVALQRYLERRGRKR